MKIQYDAEVDALYITLDDGAALDSEEVDPGVIVDYDSGDRIIGLEILSLSKRKAAIQLDNLRVHQGPIAAKS